MREALDVRSRNGDEWLAICPFRDDRRQSFSLNVAKGVFICFACGRKGKLEEREKHDGEALVGPFEEPAKVQLELTWADA